MPTKKTSTSKPSSGKPSSGGSDPKSKSIVQNKMQKTMHEFKHQELSSGRGGKVKNPKQAIAIGLSEARKSGAAVPPNPNQKRAAKKAPAKTAAKKAPAKKATTKKAATKKSTAKKTAARKR
jgi:hypothetical protein